LSVLVIVIGLAGIEGTAAGVIAFTQSPVVSSRVADHENSEKVVVKNESRRPAQHVTKGKKLPSGETSSGRRTKKMRKKLYPPVSVMPKADLSYHGMFEQRQRYDPGRDQRKGRVPNPMARELHHDHFQELDRNRDGTLDPVERARGRLDIDRDLSNRQWE
jgi:hypothetical protein